VPIDVDARCNIFAATHAAPPPADSLGSGILPVSIPLDPVPGLQLEFLDVSGLVGCCATLAYGLGNGSEGGHNASGTTDITSVGGIAGIVDPTHTLFLVGVFSADSEAVDPAPERLDFSTDHLGEDFRGLSPQLYQTFFIGDGLVAEGVGSIQGFNVPPGATRLWLGFADSYQFGDPTGPPMAYDDNLGSLHAEILIIDGNAAAIAGVNASTRGFAMQPALGDPRRGGCRIRFSLPSAQPATVTMYDVSGRRVRQVASGLALPAGDAEVAWDGRDERGGHVRGGVYFAHVSCASGAGTARVFAMP
jgi:hypothetical protein